MPVSHTCKTRGSLFGQRLQRLGQLIGAGGGLFAAVDALEPLHRFLGYHATVRASFAFYNDKTDVDRLVGSLSTVRGRMGYDD